MPSRSKHCLSLALSLSHSYTLRRLACQRRRGQLLGLPGSCANFVRKFIASFIICLSRCPLAIPCKHIMAAWGIVTSRNRWCFFIRWGIPYTWVFHPLTSLLSTIQGIAKRACALSCDLCCFCSCHTPTACYQCRCSLKPAFSWLKLNFAFIIPLNISWIALIMPLI